MKIDCRNLDCPEPIVRTKKAIEQMNILDTLEIIVNSGIALENIQKFLTANFLEFSISSYDDDYMIYVIKSNELIKVDVNEFCPPSTNRKKIIYLKYDKVGSEPIGVGLLGKFLGSLISVDIELRPSKIICVNDAVAMTTSRSHPNYAILKELESLGVKILTCGSCLEALGLVDKLGVGEITNAFEIMNLVLKNETVYI